MSVEIGKIDRELDDFHKKQRTNDVKNNWVNPVAIRLTKYETMTRAYFDCIRNYDNNEIDRVASYSQAPILAAARRRIVKFAQRGMDGAPIVASEDRIDRIEPLGVASNIVPAMDTWTELARSTQTRLQIQFFC